MNKIRNIALQNAVKFNGKANPGAVIGHIISNDPKAKSKIQEIAKEVNEIIKEVNKLSLEDQKKELEKNAPDLLKEKKHEKKEGLKELPNAKNVIMRFEPSPSGPLHIGHAYVLSLNSEYCKKYKGKLILRLGDTNPDNIYEPAYDLIPEDAEWLTKNNVSKVLIQSDRLKIYYKYFEKLLELEKAYICTCDPDEYKELITKSIACPCREIKDQKERWEKMFKGYKQGEAVARIKTDLNNNNPAMRDFPVFRINDTKHPKQGTKYRVWPLMNMAVAVDDTESKVTHVIRAKEHADNAKRQEIIHNYLDEKTPEALFVGRINFEGMPVSCSITKEEIAKGTYKDWDDIRLPFLLALRRRGFQPEAFIKYAIEVGVSLTDKTVSKDDFFKSINAFNREVIDKSSDRYFFIANPKKIKIEGAPSKEIKIELYPEDKKRGYRTFKTSDEFYIQDKLEKKNYRLMHLLNFNQNKFISEKIDDSLRAPMIHWLPVSEDLVEVEVLMDDDTVVKGLGESELKKVKKGDIVQFERNFFARLDSIEGKVYKFWYTHK
jgi:glutamyl-tRNA synthetase